MAFVALRPCRFAGKCFRIGAEIPTECVAPNRVRWFLENGFFAEIPAVSSLVDDMNPPSVKTRKIPKKAGEDHV